MIQIQLVYPIKTNGANGVLITKIMDLLILTLGVSWGNPNVVCDCCTLKRLCVKINQF